MPKKLEQKVTVETIYVRKAARFVVSLTVSYSAEDLKAGGLPVSARGAVQALVDFVEEGPPPENVYVLDRKMGEKQFLPWDLAEEEEDLDDAL